MNRPTCFETLYNTSAADYRRVLQYQTDQEVQALQAVYRQQALQKALGDLGVSCPATGLCHSNQAPPHDPVVVHTPETSKALGLLLLLLGENQ